MPAKAWTLQSGLAAVAAVMWCRLQYEMDVKRGRERDECLGPKFEGLVTQATTENGKGKESFVQTSRVNEYEFQFRHFECQASL